MSQRLLHAVLLIVAVQALVHKGSREPPQAHKGHKGHSKAHPHVNRTVNLNKNDKVKTPTLEQYLCSGYTEGSCMMSDCDSYRGHVKCESGSCMCEPGYCADGHGRCQSKEKGVELPTWYKIEPTNSPGKYLYMTSFSGEVTWWTGDPGPQGHWKIVVNNDGTIMMYTQEWGPKYWMSIEDVGGGDTVDYRGSYTTWYSPEYSAFEVHQSEEYGNALHLKHVYHEYWVEKDWDEVDGAWSLGEGTRMNFHPPLTASDHVKIIKHVAAKGTAYRGCSPLWVWVLPVAILLGWANH